MSKCEKIYGLYPGYFNDVCELDQMSASEIFFAIRKFANSIYKIKNFVGHNVENVDLSEEEYTFDFLVYYTRKFGVEIPDPQPGKRIEITDSFMDWYKTYFVAYKNIMKDYPNISEDYAKRLCLRIPK